MVDHRGDICLAPWNLLRIEQDGNCYSCSSAYVKDYYFFGNIFVDKIDDIWNGEKARKFRKDKLTKKYDYCQYYRCNLLASYFADYNIPSFDMKKIDDDYSSLISEYPTYVSLSYDFSCSEKCVFCRDKITFLDKDLALKFESIIDTKIIPLLRNVKRLELTCAGEFLASNHSQNVLKKILSFYPNIELKLFTNGIFFTKEKISELGIEKNLKDVCVSVNATKRSTYFKIFRKDNFHLVCENLKYISELKKQGKIDLFCLQFAITRDNYREIKSFVKFSEKYGAIPVFLFVVENPETQYCKNYYNYAVHKQDHYLYNHFVSIISDPLVKKYAKSNFDGFQKISLYKIFKNYVNYLKYIKNRRS